MARFAVSVFGHDRPGIVAAVTRVLADAGCNLEDTSMTILRGHFAMMLVVTGPAELGPAGLEAGLGPVAGRLDLQVGVRPVTGDVTAAPGGGTRYAAAVYGADRPGLVARVAEALAAHQVNIVDLQTRVVGEPDPVYAMHFELEVPEGRAAQVEADLSAVADALGIEASFHPDDADLLQVAVRPVLRLPATALKAVARPVAGADGAAALAADLVDTMRAYDHCVGLAAPQIGVGLRAFCLDVTGHPKARSCAGLVVLFDPEVVAAGAPAVAREGCMSVPDLTGNVARPATVAVEGITPEGTRRLVEADFIEARALLHELDHLDGLLFLDRVTSASTDLFRRRRYR